MSRVLALTTDLPYFPGRNGHDHFNLRHLATHHEVGIVAPCYDWFPKPGVENLEKFLSASFLWPRPASPVTLIANEDIAGELPRFVQRLPATLRRRVLDRLVGVDGRPDDAYEKLAILANCAPQLLAALASGHWDALILVQTNIEPWLDRLPAMGGKLVYFHDVRSDYLGRAVPVAGMAPISIGQVAAIRKQEERVTQRADVVGFVSELDLQRARRMFPMDAVAGVAPIPVDTAYYHPPPPDFQRDPRPIVLFTGHLSHPPNVDAALHFLDEIWPRIRARAPDAVFQTVGMVPAKSLQDRMADTAGVELHANVPDIRPYFWNASAYVVPMRYGGGVRQKLFEAWSMRVPVVCTTMAAEGTGAVSGKHCWLEDTPEAFADRVVSVLQRSDATPLVDAAKVHVEAHNSIASAAPQFEALVQRAVAIKKQAPVKVLYDLRWMEIGKAGGIEQATYELISSIGRLDRRNEYRVYAPRSTCSEWEVPRGFNIRFAYSDMGERGAEALSAYCANQLAEGLGRRPVMTPVMTTLSKYHHLDFDLVHAVAGYIHPDLLGFPSVLTINDLQHLHYPQFFTPTELEERERLYRASANSARHIICISEYTRQDVHRQYGIPLEKMSTVWIIPSRSAWVALPERSRRDLLASLGVTGRYLLFPAHCWPHKNHAKLIEAMELIEAELPADVTLVMTGRPFPAGHPAAARIRDWKQGARRVRHLGFRSPREMQALIQGCTALVFPSLFEGYGMPVAEAIIAGRPVICSNVTSLPEIAGDAAITFDPNDAADIGRRILELVSRPDRERALTDAALRRRSRFSARRITVETLSIYQRVYNELYGD
ncbi:glycosyltransferase [Usitatibacter palustris]|uniref:D-inositol-3-phosphate glycosyltransferase n=1 Tax=Usitatibacter palustris TaxID=2732487 RepID=A0A6M4HD76_9PROT|nr:glycosyltransferase [Usitatibacter palustris]QJR16493.1 D-inositol-3-phosphate glycosyltransferase [Usitatibacter palustris]